MRVSASKILRIAVVAAVIAFVVYSGLMVLVFGWQLLGLIFDTSRHRSMKSEVLFYQSQVQNAFYRYGDEKHEPGVDGMPLPSVFPDDFPSRAKLDKYCPVTGAECSYLILGGGNKRLGIVMDSVPHKNGDVFVIYASSERGRAEPARFWDGSVDLIYELFDSSRYRMMKLESVE